MDSKNQSSNAKKHTTGNPVKKKLLDNFHKKLAQEVKTINPKTVLEAGCGEGFVIEHLKTALPETTFHGFDFSEQAVKIAQQKLPQTKIATGDLTTLDTDFLNQSFGKTDFDLVLCLEVLEHIKDHQKALERLKAINTNHYIFSVPNEPFFRLSNLMALKNIPDLGNDPGHVNNWTTTQFENLISDHFTIIKKLKPFPWQIIICKKKN
jgi:2-polyprenyl-3-methyl-5-hydroxy-6-metoxy-1,4-benzoquinol methylase